MFVIRQSIPLRTRFCVIEMLDLRIDLNRSATEGSATNAAMPPLAGVF